MTESLPIDLARLVVILQRYRVDYVIVGGIAALMQGASRPTSDVDLLIDSSKENIERFLEVCRELRMRNRTGKPDLDAQLADRAAKRTWYVSDVQDIFWSAQSDIGPIDVLPTMAMTNGRAAYSQIADEADEVVVAGTETVRVKIATVSQLIESKEAVGREKDLEVVAELRSLASKPTSGKITDDR